MKVNNVPIDSIKPYENNPRNNDDAVESTATLGSIPDVVFCI